MKALCNGFLAGVAAVSVGSGGMQPYYAVLAGIIAAPCYLLGCFIFKNFMVDDPIENCQIYILPIFWASINSVAFQDTEGILVMNTNNIDMLGTQLLGFALITILVVVVTWGFFFPMKRLNKLRIEKSVEVIGRDTLMNAESKGLDLT